MNNIKFTPWVGTEYFTKGYNGKRILILGESHYCGDCAEGGECYPECTVYEECKMFTNNVINGVINEYTGSAEERYQQTFQTLERSMLGRELTQEERIELWNSIVFYNYVQVALPEPNMSPTAQQFRQGESAFLEILETYMPDYIIAWGARLYNHLPDWDGEHKVVEVDGDSTDVWVYTVKGKQIPVMKVLHPCRGKGRNWAYWHKLYTKFFE